MSNNDFFLTIGLAIMIMLIPFFLYILLESEPVFPDTSKEPQEENSRDNQGVQEETGSESNPEPEVLWGVDSVSYTDESLYQCVIDNFGSPDVWGRYLEDREGVSYGLDTEEVQYMHEDDILILVISNHVNDTRGYDLRTNASIT